LNEGRKLRVEGVNQIENNMEKTHRPKHPLDGGIYTLGQSGTNNNLDYSQIPDKMVFGNGSDLSDKQAWERRAKRKLITQRLMLALVDVAKKRGDLKQVQRYWNAYHCQSNLTHSNGRVYGNYCKSRYCLVCLSIRKAVTLNNYLPILQTWKNPYFVTLTVRSAREDKLKLWMKAMKVAFRRIRERCKKRNQRGKLSNFMGIKSLECNFNPIKKTYNPHYHLLVPSKEIAETLRIEWLRTWNKKEILALPFPQQKRPVDRLQSDLEETVKYGAKIFTDPSMNKGKNKSILPIIYAAAMDNIFMAMDGYRLFDRFGFNLPKHSPKPKVLPSFLQNYEDVVFDKIANDWVNYDTGELLTGYKPTPQLEFLLNNHIDKDTT